MNGYAGKRVVITGGSDGIGLATARLMLAGDAAVVITGRSAERLAAAKAQLGANVTAVQCDQTDRHAVAALADRVRTEFGGVDLLFINGGITRWVPFLEVDEAIYDELFDVIAKAAFFTVQAFVPVMADGSSIVLNTSVANVKGIPTISVYAAGKAALRSMARSMASELLPRGIRVNAISPGAIDTGFLHKALPREAADQRLAQMKGIIPMQRLGRAEEVAAAVAFLAFDATYTTGAELPVDGGGSQL